VSGLSILADTNPLIYLLNGDVEVADYLDGKQVWISAITELELYGKKGLKNSEIKEIDFLIENCFVADINSEIKQITKRLIQETSIKLPDAIMSPTSLYLGIPLFTSDNGFKKISEIDLVLF